MEGLRQQSKSSAQDERGYGSVNPGTVHLKAAQKPRTTYAPAVVYHRSQQPSGSQPGASLPAPTSSVTGGNLVTSQAADASQSAIALRLHAPHGNGSIRFGLGGQEEPSHAFEYAAPSQPHTPGPFGSGLSGSVVSFARQSPSTLRLRVCDPLGLVPGGQTAAQTGKPGALEVLRQDVDALGRATRELYGRVDRRVPPSTLKELRRGLDALSHEVHDRMPSYAPQGYSYHSAYGYGAYASSSHSVPSYPSYDTCSSGCPEDSASFRGVLTLAFLRPRRRTQRIVIPLKTPHVERRVNGVIRAMPDQDRKGSDEAVIQLVAPYRAYQV
ncbi:LOW QUALITY PROTEIN: Hypothetical protein PHPALM_18273 [Phytophthora palmivora]|uniref:Uncharacterized protein n=1 Tax=Phytophthora palmivora TaxID=4796 RepID=A0A2P4XK64_9STRA|nr:LOW QUALITY PROTEIN: Hypothetical protein PHPALM_18273 [Phytophthora palmivora]